MFYIVDATPATKVCVVRCLSIPAFAASSEMIMATYAAPDELAATAYPQAIIGKLVAHAILMAIRFLASVEIVINFGGTRAIMLPIVARISEISTGI